MKIVHVSLLSIYTDDYSYQDNLLPKYHKKLKNDVSVIVSRRSRKEGNIIMVKSGSYINSDGVKIIRLNSNNDKNYRGNTIFSKFIKYEGLYDTIENENPDVLFVHGCQFLDIRTIVNYIKNHENVKVYVDNHSDEYNSGKNFFSFYILHKIIWKHMAHLIEPYTTKFYGVLPNRVEWLINVYNLPKSKCELLKMGIDDELLSKIKKDGNISAIKNKLGIKENDIVFCTGGKIDKNKYQILNLMRVFNNINANNAKLLVFGSIDDGIKKEFSKLCDCENIKYIGWLNNYDAMMSFYISNIVVFPGLHSVYWEQAVALGKPLVCKYIKGVSHIDIGGNVVFLNDDNYDTLKTTIEKLVSDINIYNNLRTKAMSKKRREFLYSVIAKRSIEGD